MTTLPSDYISQVSYISNLISELNELDSAIDGLTLLQTTQPTHNEWETAWVNSGRTLPIQPGAELIWHDGSVIRGIFSVVNDDIVRLLMEFQWSAYTVATPVNIVKSVDVDADSKSVLAVGSWDDLNSVTINFIDRDGVWTSIGAVAGTEAYAKLNDDGTKIAYLDSVGNVIYKVNRNGSGATNIINGYGVIVLKSWSGPYIAFVAGTTIRLATDTGAIVSTINPAGAVTIGEVIYNATNNLVYYVKNGNLYSNNLAGAAETLIYTNSGNYFDIDITNQKIYINHYTRFNVDGTNIETVNDIVYQEYLNIFNTQIYGSNNVAFGAATLSLEAYYWLMNVFSSELKEFVLAPNKKYFVRRYTQDSVIHPDQFNILIIPNYFEEGKSSGFIWRLTEFTAGVEDFQKIAEGSLDAHAPFIELTIPQTHGDLMIVANLQTYDNTALADVGIIVNDDVTANNYNNFHRDVTNVMTKTETLNAGYIRLRSKGRLYNPTTNYSNTVIFIHDYKESTMPKQFLGIAANPARTDATPNIYLEMSVGVYIAANNGITKLKFYATTGLNLHSGSYVSVYGLNTKGGVVDA